MKPLIATSLLALGLSWPVLSTAAGLPDSPSWAAEALAKEADYIVNCSFTELARNHQAVTPSSDAYGALNVNRIYQRGPDWVRPGEAAMGAIGLMAAAMQLQAERRDISAYDQVLDRFFQTWLLARKQPLNTDRVSPDYGGFVERVHYGITGTHERNDCTNAGVTGQMITAMWKYYEYNVAVGKPQTARNWLEQSWTIARLGGDFLQRNYDPTYRLVRSNAGSRDLWVTDGTYAAMALRCLDKWAMTSGKKKPFDYGAVSGNLIEGLQALKDNGTKKNFLRYRDSSRPSYPPTYGDQIDQTCFLPYEADVLDPGETFARAISDWWTNGSEGIRLTIISADPNDWRNYGTRYHYSFNGPEKTDYLYPGPGLQLAKVEWKYARSTGDPTTLERARKRLQWAISPAYSHLWLGADGASEANVENGFVDWRDGSSYTHRADDWQRFVDTSAYLIEALLMLEYGVDTKYVPN